MPVKIYDSDKKKLMGVFKTATLAARYIYKPFDGKKCSTIFSAIKLKNKICNSTLFSHPIAVRTAAETELPDGKYWLISEGYPEPTAHQMHGFCSMSVWRSKNTKVQE